MDPITKIMVGLAGVLFLFVVAMLAWFAMLALWDFGVRLAALVRGLIGVRQACAREDRTLDTVARVRKAGAA